MTGNNVLREKDNINHPFYNEKCQRQESVDYCHRYRWIDDPIFRNFENHLKYAFIYFIHDHLEYVSKEKKYFSFL